jgi:hypothetical protein
MLNPETWCPWKKKGMEKQKIRPGMIVHTCNSSYARGIDCSPRPALAKKCKTYLKNDGNKNGLQVCVSSGRAPA